MKKINERCITHNECESDLCFQGICTDNNSGKFYNTDFNQIYGSNKRNDLRDKLPEKHFKQIVQTIYITNPNLSGTFILDRNSREIIYSSPSTTPPLDVNWEIVHRYMLLRYGNGIF